MISALRRLPHYFRKKLENVDVVIEDRASQELVSEMELQSPFNCWGSIKGYLLSGEVSIMAMSFLTRSPSFRFLLNQSVRRRKRSKKR